MRRAVVAASLGLSALAAVGAAVAIPLALAPEGCAIHACDYSIVSNEHDPGAFLKDGRVLDQNTWESNAIDEPWLPFPGQREWILNFPDFKGRRVVETHAYLSVDDRAGFVDANGGNSNWAEASGNLAEFRDPANIYCDAGGVGVLCDSIIIVKNDTCSNYYLRVVLTFAPVEDAGADAAGDAEIDANTSPDGGADGGGAAKEAGLDAGVD